MLYAGAADSAHSWGQFALPPLHYIPSLPFLHPGARLSCSGGHLSVCCHTRKGSDLPMGPAFATSGTGGLHSVSAEEA